MPLLLTIHLYRHFHSLMGGELASRCISLSEFGDWLEEPGDITCRRVRIKDMREWNSKAILLRTEPGLKILNFQNTK